MRASPPTSCTAPSGFRWSRSCPTTRVAWGAPWISLVYSSQPGEAFVQPSRALLGRNGADGNWSGQSAATRRVRVSPPTRAGPGTTRAASRFSHPKVGIDPTSGRRMCFLIRLGPHSAGRARARSTSIEGGPGILGENLPKRTSGTTRMGRRPGKSDPSAAGRSWSGPTVVIGCHFPVTEKRTKMTVSHLQPREDP